MRVIKSSFAQSIHEMCAELTRDEFDYWKGRSVCSSLGACVCAVAARVVAVAANTLWVLSEAVQFVPRMISLGIGLAHSEKAGLTTEFIGRIAKVYTLAIKTTLAQLGLAIGGIVLPELVYQKLELHKALFSLELKALVETLPEFPYVANKPRSIFPPVDSLVQLYQRLGMTNEQFRQDLSSLLRDTYDHDQKVGTQILSPSSDYFQRAFFSVLFTKIATELNRRQDNGTFAQELVRHINPGAWIPLITMLTPQTQLQLFTHIPTLEVELQNDRGYALAFERATGYRYRSPFNTAACNHLLDKMKVANGELIKEKIFTAEEIMQMEGSAFGAIITLGLFKFVDEASLETSLETNPLLALIVTTASGQRITLKSPEQFFETQSKLVELKQELIKLWGEQRKALFERCCGSEESVIKAKKSLHPLFNNPAVVKCFNLLVGLKHGVVEKKMNTDRLRPQDVTAWGEAFEVPESLPA